MKRALFIPPEAGFLKTLARWFKEHHPVREWPEATFIFPTRRAGLYFQYYLAQELKAPFLPPRIYTLGDFINEWAARLDPRPLIPAAERAWWLYRLAQRPPLFGSLSESFDRFLPWGLKLSEVLEELEKEEVEPRDLPYPPEDLPPAAQELLAHLAQIGEDYRRLREEKDFTTPAERSRLLAKKLGEVLPPGKYYFCGFAALSQTEKKILGHLLEAGGEVFFEAPMEERPEFLEDILNFLHLRPEAFPSSKFRPPRITFRVAADVHQECENLARLLPRSVKAPDEVLILLPIASHLLPLLYSLPSEVPLNITLGYPLRRSLPAAFLLHLIDLYEKRLAQRYPATLYLAFLKHPYLRTRLPDSPKALRRIETRLREHGSPYLTLEEIEALTENPALKEMHEEFLRPFETLKTPRQFAQLLYQVLDQALEPFKENLKTAQDNQDLLARHFLWTLENEILPLFTTSPLADEPLKPETLFRLFRELLAGAKAPFEGEPLQGLQVMGLLETRLLCFRRVIVLDANEGALPSPEEINPLLPEGLRPALGLPPRSRQEVLERFHFFRLIRAAREVDIFYLSVTEPSPRKPPLVRSRYVERLLWEKEQRQRRLLGPEALNHLPLTLKPPRWETGLPKGKAEKEALEKLLQEREISASFLETYLDCAAKFYFRYLLGLRPPERISEYDPAELGELIHRVLELYFKPYQGRYYSPAEEDPEALLEIFRREFRRHPLYHRLGPERRLFISRTAEFRLRRYLARLKEFPPFQIVKIEEEVRYTHPQWGLRFYGRIDRIDRFDQKEVILDYKTGGRIRSLSLKRLKALLEEPLDAPPTLEGLRHLKERMPDLQLMLYLFLWQQAEEAVYIHLAAGKGSELFKPLLYQPPFSSVREGFSPAEIQKLRQETFPKLLESLLNHLLEAPAFFVPEPPPRCRYCDYRYACPLRRPC